MDEFLLTSTSFLCSLLTDSDNYPRQIITYHIIYTSLYSFNFITSSPGARQIYNGTRSKAIPYHAVPSIIAINVIMAVAAGGTIAVIISMWARVYTIQFTLASYPGLAKFTYKHVVVAT